MMRSTALVIASFCRSEPRAEDHGTDQADDDGGGHPPDEGLDQRLLESLKILGRAADQDVFAARELGELAEQRAAAVVHRLRQDERPPDRRLIGKVDRRARPAHVVWSEQDERTAAFGEILGGVDALAQRPRRQAQEVLRLPPDPLERGLAAVAARVDV
ncbi:hypothetical protein ABIC20_001619 [Methylobacterium radiotolerans]|uniref:Uncharacterized protein n=1 Tax=Methylobacterium radiotolerans TaxID=31998 RepID=A0ABV2NCU8_9HYPH